MRSFKSAPAGLRGRKGLEAGSRGRRLAKTLVPVSREGGVRAFRAGSPTNPSSRRLETRQTASERFGSVGFYSTNG